MNSLGEYNDILKIKNYDFFLTLKTNVAAINFFFKPKIYFLNLEIHQESANFKSIIGNHNRY